MNVLERSGEVPRPACQECVIERMIYVVVCPLTTAKLEGLARRLLRRLWSDLRIDSFCECGAPPPP
jgi:hypothetical protein